MLPAMERVLVLGATSAIASEIAALYAARGASLWLVGRDAAKLDALRERLGAAVVGSERADLDELGDNARRIERAIAALGGVDLAIVAHGLLGDQAATEREWASAEQVLRTNLLSPVSLLIPLAEHFERHGRGAIVVLSSVAGVRGRPRNYTYGAAKGALTIYTQGLRSRLWPAGVGVHTIKLGPVDSPMTVDHEKNRLFARPEAVSRAVVAAVDGGRGEIYVPWFWAPIMTVVQRLPERVFQRLRLLSAR
jgi:short-subunit dehydrogenase